MKNKKPLVSVIMPVYNAGSFLVEAIESILAQTYKNFELIIVDDASTDSSWKTIDYFQKKYPKKIKAIRLKKNRGMGGEVAGDIGYRKSKGEFVARMDADDVAKPNRLEKQVKYLVNNPNVSILGSSAHVIDEDGEIIGIKNTPKSHSAIYKAFFAVHPMIHPTVMIRKNSFKSKEFYKIEYSRNNDYFTFFGLITSGYKFRNLADKLLYYRIHEKNDSLSLRKTFVNTLKIRYRAMFEFGYKPTVIDILKVAAQTLVVFVLPRKVMFNLYLVLRGISKPEINIEFLKTPVFARLRKTPSTAS